MDFGQRFYKHNDTYPAIDPAKKDFSGKYVFVTGPSRGIGHETALAFAAAGVAGLGLGARSDLSPLVTAITEVAQAAGKPVPKIVAVKLDVTDEASIVAAAEEVAKSFPRLDVLINNAGYLEWPKPIIESDPKEWWYSWEVNVKGPYLVARGFLPLMLERGGQKTIVNVTSSGIHMLMPGSSAYLTSKFALQRFVEAVDAEYGAQGLLVYNVHPGSVVTAMADRLPPGARSHLTDSPKLCAHTLVFLTEKRRDWLAARYVASNWDMEEFMAKEAQIVKGDKLKFRMEFE